MPNVPAVIKKVEAIDSDVYTKNIPESVKPFTNEYRMNIMMAVLALMRWIAPARLPTAINCKMISPKNVMRLPKTKSINVSEVAVYIAMAPVMKSARHIQPYTFTM